MSVVAVALAIMWSVEGLDEFVLGDRLEREGIHPRSVEGLDGILWAPWLHSGWRHLISNSVPLAVLGTLTFSHGRHRGWTAVATIVVFGGSATWLFARSGNHIGASGLVFGLFGYLLASAIFARRLAALVTAIAAVMFYGGLVWGFMPTPGVSWESHIFGFVAGVGCARHLGRGL